MNPFEKKAIFIWVSSKIEGGDPARIVGRLVEAGFEAAYLHTSDGVYPQDYKHRELVDKMHQAGLAVAGWGAVYGSNAEKEGKVAAARVSELGLDGYVFDAESLWDAQKNAVNNVGVLYDAFRSTVSVPTAWCWWALPLSPTGVEWHPLAVGQAGLRRADYGMPMMYWQGSSAIEAINYLERSLTLWRKVTDKKPIIPVGRAYTGDGGTASTEAIVAFARRARELGCPGISWWSMMHALNGGLWPALTQANGKDPEVEWAKAIDAWARTMGYAGPKP